MSSVAATHRAPALALVALVAYAAVGVLLSALSGPVSASRDARLPTPSGQSPNASAPLAICTTVLDAGRRPVGGLQTGDFTVRVGGVERAVTSIDPFSGRPRTFLILIDRNTMEHGDARSARTAAAAIVDGLGPGESVALVVLPEVNQRVTPTTDLASVHASLASATGRSQDIRTFAGSLADRVALNDTNDKVVLEARVRAAELLTSVCLALDQLRGRGPVVAVLLSNRIVTSNWNEPEIERTAAVAAALRSPIFALPLNGEGWIHSGPAVGGMRTLVERTGGAVIPVEKNPLAAARRVLEESAGVCVLGLSRASSDRGDQRTELAVTLARAGASLVRAPTRLVVPAGRGLIASPFLGEVRASWAAPTVTSRNERRLPAAPLTTVSAADAAIVGRATAFVEQSASEAPVLVADEVYEQHVKRDLPARDVLFFDRAMRSTVAWVRLPAVDDIWVPFRDVLEVDGVRVDDWDHRLEATLVGSSESAVTDAAAIDALGWRFQIGSLARRTTNAMLPLAFLLTTYRDRFVFRSRGAEAVDGVSAVRVDYTEQATPTLAWAPRGSARAVRSQGSFWIVPGTGRVLKATLIWTEGLFLTSDFTITYQPVGSAGIAPAVLQERYRTLSDVAAPGMLFEMTSRYTNVRAAGSPAR